MDIVVPKELEMEAVSPDCRVACSVKPCGGGSGL
jgi:hypothetical protein